MTIREQLEQKYGTTTPTVRQQLETKYAKPPEPVAPAPTSTPPQSGLSKIFGGVEKVGGAMEGAGNFLFGSAAKTAGTAITKGIGGATSLYGDITGNQKAKEVGKKLENIPMPSKTDTAFAAIELYPGGGFVTSALRKMAGGSKLAEGFSKILQHIPEGLRETAIKQYSEALGATTNELKKKTAKVVPELLDRGEKILSLPAFGQKAENMIDAAGQAVKTAESKLPVFKKQAVDPIIQRVSKMREQFIINGKVIDDSAVKAIDNVLNSITQYGKEIAETQLVKIRRVLDKSVSLANKNFTKDEGLSLATEAKQAIANSIRNVLNSANPNLAKANKEFSLWSDVSKIVAKTLERKSTQSGGITRFLGPLIGAGGLGATTGDPLKAVLAYFGTDAVIKLFQSPAYKTISAINKNKLANFLASGRIKDAMLLTNKLISGIRNEISD